MWSSCLCCRFTVLCGPFCSLQARARSFRSATLLLFVASNILVSVLVPYYDQSSSYLAVIAWIVVCYHGWMCVSTINVSYPASRRLFDVLPPTPPGHKFRGRVVMACFCFR